VWGCASAPAPGESVSLNQKAAEAYARGDYASARASYARAVQIHTDSKNVEGAALNGLSLARVEHAAGNSDAAHRALDAVLASPAAPALRAEAAGRKALLFLGAGELPAAAEWQARAQALCGACRAQAAILNIGARIALADGQSATAAQMAERVLHLPATEETRAEQASARRILTEAQSVQPRFAQPAGTPREQVR
jgi:tetratricopeptide (TPR) repeat protein